MTYANQTVVKQECPDADEDEIGKEFSRYENEFLIPPEDALRSVIRKFQAAGGLEASGIASVAVRERENRAEVLGTEGR